MTPPPQFDERRTRASRARARLVACASAAALGVTALSAGALLTMARASAIYQEVVETGAPGYLKLRTDDAHPLWATLTPGDTMHWVVEASLHDTDRGALSLELRSQGALVDAAGLTAAIRSCDRTFTSDIAHATASPEPRCEGTAEQVLPPTPLAQLADLEGGTVHSLADLTPDLPRHLLVTLRLPETAEFDASTGARAVVGLGVHAEGERSPSLPPGPSGPDDLPATGADLLALALLGAGLAGLGTAAVLRRRLRPRTSGGGR